MTTTFANSEIAVTHMPNHPAGEEVGPSMHMRATPRMAQVAANPWSR